MHLPPPSLIRRRLAALVLAGVASAAYSVVIDPVVDTSWDVRRDADELLDDLKARRGETAQLLERVATMLATNGDRLISAGAVFAPISEVLIDKLRDLGLLAEFEKAFEPVAEHRLAELRAGSSGDAQWRMLAVSFPGTPAARAAWQHLADLAWDSGRLGLYLSYARQSGEINDAERRQRSEAALHLLSSMVPIVLPASLDGLDEMWRLDLDEPQAANPRQRVAGDRQPVLPTLSLSEPQTVLTAASDGVRFFVFDNVVGRIQGSVIRLGEEVLRPEQATPARARDGFVALGRSQSRAVLAFLDRLGEQRWRASTQPLGNMRSLSAPLVVDDLVVFAGILQLNDGPELRLYAYRLSDGSPAWESMLAKLPVQQMQLMMQMYEYSAVVPTLCLHAGSLIVSSNSGIIAQVASNGSPRRIWSYATASGRPDDILDRGPGRDRRGVVKSDGANVVLTPADAPNTVFILSADDAKLRSYTGDGSACEVVDVADGRAVLAGPQLCCLDLARGRLAWSRETPLFNAFGAIGAGRALLAGRDRLALVDLSDGSTIAQRAFEPPATFASIGGTLLIARHNSIAAWGKAQAYLDDLLAQAKRDPGNYRPLVALSSLYQARGNHERAYTYLATALEHGAPAEYASRAARLVRGRLELSLDDPASFQVSLGQLQALAAYDARLIAEVHYWRGRHAELAKDLAAAAVEYREVLKQPTTRIAVNQLEFSAQAVAQASLARMKQAPLPAWMSPAPAAAIPPAPKQPWSVAGSRAPTMVMSRELAIGYTHGALVATRILDGKELWRRRPDRPLLGVTSSNQPAGDRVALQVLPGSAAAAAGLRNGDVMITYNGKEIHDFTDLPPAVLDTGIDGRFTITVQREHEPVAVTVTGTLGGDLVEPIAASEHIALIWPTAMGLQRPEGMWIAALDIATGKELWRHHHPAITVPRSEVPRPLLTADEVVITADANDLIALSARGDGASELWRRKEGASLLGQARLIGSLLMLREEERACVLIDPATGEELFRLPGSKEECQSVLEDGDFIAIGADSRLACWDLSQGMWRWRTDKPMWRIATASGDGIYAIDADRKLQLLDRFSGKVRRIYGDWAAVEDFRPTPTRLYLVIVDPEQGKSLAAVALPGGANLWERSMPRRMEVQSLIVGADGCGCVVAESEQSPTLAFFTPDGQLRHAAAWGASQSVALLNGAFLIAGNEGMAVVDGAIPAAPAPIPCAEAAVGTLPEVAAGVAAKLSWQPVGQAAYALARSGNALLVFARLPPEADALEVRLGDSGPAIDPLNQALVFHRNQTTTFNDAPEGWRIVSTHRLSGEADTWTAVARLEPPATRAAHAVLQTRGAAAGASDCPSAPWWLRGAWRTVANGP